jgi:hypothetical protein
MERLIYVLYRIVARITSIFDETRFPCNDHLLTICIEDPSYTRQEMVYVADSINSSVRSRVKVPGYLIYKEAKVEKPILLIKLPGRSTPVEWVKSYFLAIQNWHMDKARWMGIFLKEG